MSAATVRAAIATYFQVQAIPNLTVYRAQPRQSAVPGNVPGVLTWMILFPEVGEQEEIRLGFGAKKITYTVTLEALGYSLQQDAQDAADDRDAFLSSIDAAIRLDPTLGTAGQNPSIFQAGEGDGMATPDIRWRRDPVLEDPEDSGLHLWSHLSLTALEVLHA